MANENTERFGLLIVDPIENENDTFNIEAMLNDNWRKMEQAAKSSELLAYLLKSGGVMTGKFQVPFFGIGVRYQKTSFQKAMVDFVGQSTEFEIDLGAETIVGNIVVEIASGWSTGNASGKLVKSFDISANGVTILAQDSKYTYTSPFTKAHFMISDIYMREANKYIKIIQNSASKNMVYATVEFMGAFPLYTELITSDVIVSTVPFVSPETNLAYLNSPTFAGTPTAPTPATNDKTTKIATTDYVRSQELKGQVTVTNASWIASGNALFPFKKNAPITGVVVVDKPINFDFTLSTYAIAETAGISYVETYAGGITLFAKAVPSGSVVADYVVRKA